MRKYLEDIIQGRNQNFGAVCIRTLFLPFSFIYTAGVALRNGLYTSGILRTRKVPVPVISIGNLTVGGTGKTPAALMIAEFFLAQKKKTALIARGYGNKVDGLNDELRMALKKFPDLMVYADSDRAAAAARAAEDRAEIIILDDGFQHRRLHRDCNILTVDSRNSAAPGFLLPAGPFREPWQSRKRADIILMTKCAPDGDITLKSDTRSDIPIFFTAHIPSGIVTGDRIDPVEILSGKKVFLISGIGDSSYFRAVAESVGCIVSKELCFPDHHDYSAADIEAIGSAFSQSEADSLLTTEKDLLKLEERAKNAKINIEFSALAVTMKVLQNGKEFFQEVTRRAGIQTETV